MNDVFMEHGSVCRDYTWLDEICRFRIYYFDRLTDTMPVYFFWKTFGIGKRLVLENVSNTLLIHYHVIYQNSMGFFYNNNISIALLSDNFFF